MRRIVTLVIFLALAGWLHAAGPDDQYLEIYGQILQADNLQQAGNSEAAAQKYSEANTALQKLQESHPSWNTEVVKFRLEYLSEKMGALSKFLKATNVTPAAVVAPAAPAPATAAEAEKKAEALEAQIRDLLAANADLQQKLKEALAARPASVDPEELAKAEKRIVALEKERDLLNVALEEEKQKSKNAPKVVESKSSEEEMARLKKELNDAKMKLEAVSGELGALQKAQLEKPDTRPEIKLPTDETKALAEERDRLKKELDSVTKELADSESQHDEAVLSAKTMAAKLKEVEEQRADLEKKLEMLAQEKPEPGKEVSASTAEHAQAVQIGQLRARLAVLEATAVPYTAEELAVLNKIPPKPGEPAVAVANEQHIVHTMKDLPPGAGPLMADAQRAVQEHDYDAAEKKYLEILRQDESNVYVLEHLANAEFMAGHFDDCQKSVNRALALDPNDSASLYWLGNLRLHEEKLDEALDALSRSATFAPTNPATQFTLGTVLLQKGMRTAAETALRKALQADPDYADAHYTLAFVYATEKPPSVELARWHYKKAMDLGHAANSDLEKLMAENK